MRCVAGGRTALFVGLVLGLAAGAPTARAQQKDETVRWVPAISAFGGVLVQNAKADVVSSLVAGTTQPIRPAASGSDVQVTPFVGGQLELMTPVLFDAPGRPRLFVHAGAAGSFAFDRDIAKEGLPGALMPTPGLPPTSTIVEATVAGQGSVTSAKVRTILVSAGAGVALTFEAWDRRFRLKPSVEWMREEIEVSGEVSRAVQTSFPAIAGNFPQGFRLINLAGKERKAYNGIGPGIEFEADTARVGPLFLTVYIAGQAYHFLGDLEVEFTESQCSVTPPCTPAQVESATWSFEKNRWAFQSGVGLRFRWLPE
jgi:hypothetical protein